MRRDSIIRRTEVALFRQKCYTDSSQVSISEIIGSERNSSMSYCPVLSIILPVFNGEAFIRRTIESVCKQELQEWELIIVNDGSTDRSEDIISYFCTLDSRITKISQENKGLSAARNAGYYKARGTYIVFLDADDFVEPNYYKKLVACTERSGAEFVVSGYVRDFVQPNGQTKEQVIHFEEILLNELKKVRDSCKQMYFYNVYIHVWNKIYRREFIEQHKIVFEESRRYAEDVPYNIAVLKHANSIQFIDIPGYHYVCHQADRLTGKWRDSLLKDNGEVYCQIVDYESKYLQIEKSEIASGMYLRSCFLALEKTIAMQMPYSDIKRIMKDLFAMTALEDSLTTLEHGCRSKEFMIYKEILKFKIPFVFYIAVVLRKLLKHIMGR